MTFGWSLDGWLMGDASYGVMRLTWYGWILYGLMNDSGHVGRHGIVNYECTELIWVQTYQQGTSILCSHELDTWFQKLSGYYADAKNWAPAYSHLATMSHLHNAPWPRTPSHAFQEPDFCPSNKICIQMCPMTRAKCQGVPHISSIFTMLYHFHQPFFSSQLCNIRFAYPSPRATHMQMVRPL